MFPLNSEIMVSTRISIIVFGALACLLFALPLSHAFVRLSLQTRTSLVAVQAVKELTAEERAIALEKATKAMTAFTNKYLENTCTKLCVDKSVPAVVIKGLAEHKVNLGAPLCPCRFYDDKEKEAKDGYWNCPCVPMRERHECHCMLFLTEQNEFVGEETVRC
jgi:ferredoxin-thioredoxin reductase catalytic chain